MSAVFRQSSLGDLTIVQEQQYVEPTEATAVIGGPVPAQHSVRFGKASRLRGMDPSERRTVLVRLASLLLEAASAATAEEVSMR